MCLRKALKNGNYLKQNPAAIDDCIRVDVMTTSILTTVHDSLSNTIIREIHCQYILNILNALKRLKENEYRGNIKYMFLMY